MKVLVVKTSSLGDVIHTLPAVTDAAQALPGIRFDWVVEEGFAEIPAWHPAVQRVIPIGLRQWRKGWRQAWRSGRIKVFRKALRKETYDLIIDAQGLLKSAAVALMAKGDRAGLDRNSARESWVAWSYHKKAPVHRQMHAVERVRRLFAQALNYTLPDTIPDYGVREVVHGGKSPYDEAGDGMFGAPYLLFLHGTTWVSKLWPESYWRELASLAVEAGYLVRIPWAGREERARAERIAAVAAGVNTLPSMSLIELAYELVGAAGVVGVDTGLIHLAAALEIPSVTLYGATSPKLTGTRGSRQLNLAAEFPCAPCLRKACDFKGATTVRPACYKTLAPAYVFDQFTAVVNS